MKKKQTKKETSKTNAKVNVKVKIKKIKNKKKAPRLPPVTTLGSWVLYFNKKAKTNSLIKLCLNAVRSVFILVDILIVFISFFTKIFVNIK